MSSSQFLWLIMLNASWGVVAQPVSAPTARHLSISRSCRSVALPPGRFTSMKTARPLKQPYMSSSIIPNAEPWNFLTRHPGTAFSFLMMVATTLDSRGTCFPIAVCTSIEKPDSEESGLTLIFI